MITFKNFLLYENNDWITKSRVDREVHDNLQKMIKKQATKPKKAFQAKIYTTYGGGSILVWSFANTSSKAIQEIENLPHFKSFAKRPVAVTLDF